MNQNKFRIVFIIISFVCFISISIINNKLKFIKDIENTENRKLAEKPTIDINHLDDFPSAFDKYYSDNFSFRQRLVAYFNELNLRFFNKSPMPDKVIIGHDGWLFMAGNEADTYLGKNGFTVDELEILKQEFEYRKKYLSDMGCKFYIMIAPAKALVYSDKMPSSMYRLIKQSWGEQLLAYLKNYSTVSTIDIYQTLRDKKGYDLIYYKLDNHWNQKGAFYAANEAILNISKDFPVIGKPLNISDYIINDSVINTGNIVGMLSNTTIYTDTAYKLTPKSGYKSTELNDVGYKMPEGFPYSWEFEYVREIPKSGLPKILIICDSFGNNIYPFLYEKFGRSVKIFDSWQYKLNEPIVENEKPDIVLLLVLESNLKNVLNNLTKK